MISKETAQKIWTAYREIETAEKLLSDMKEIQEKTKTDPHTKDLKDVFGRQRSLELGIPSGENSHRILRVRSCLAEPVINSHIANMKAELAKANEIAKLELENPIVGAVKL